MDKIYEELRTITANLELAKKYYDWEIVDRATQRLAELTMTLANRE